MYIIALEFGFIVLGLRSANECPAPAAGANPAFVTAKFAPPKFPRCASHLRAKLKEARRQHSPLLLLHGAQQQR